MVVSIVSNVWYRPLQNDAEYGGKQAIHGVKWLLVFEVREIPNK